MSILWILGASDPEMTAIETLLAECGQDIRYAVVDGERVRPNAAYRATTYRSPTGMSDSTRSPGRVVLVECGFTGIDEPTRWPDAEIVRVDHHRPGDAGYGRHPREFLPASSIGQVLGLLAAWGSPGGLLARAQWPGHLYLWVEEPGPVGSMLWRPKRGWVVYPQRAGEEGWEVVVPEVPILLTAAADHCLAAAYGRKCPGVSPVVLRGHRAQIRARWLNDLPPTRPEVEAVLLAVCPSLAYEGDYRDELPLTYATVLEAWAASTRDLAKRPIIDLGGHDVRDLRERVLAEAPEVLAQAGECGLYRLDAKLGVIGAGEGTGPGPGPVEAFMAVARAGGEVCGTPVDPDSVYGDPARGFAGATVL